MTDTIGETQCGSKPRCLHGASSIKSQIKPLILTTPLATHDVYNRVRPPPRRHPLIKTEIGENSNDTLAELAPSRPGRIQLGANSTQCESKPGHTNPNVAEAAPNFAACHPELAVPSPRCSKSDQGQLPSGKGAGVLKGPRGGAPAGRNPRLRRRPAARERCNRSGTPSYGEGGRAKLKHKPRAPHLTWRCACGTRGDARHTVE